MSTTRQEMACRECGRPLNTFGSLDNPRYIHPLASGIRDHQPIPVPATDLDTIVRQCDFCSAENPLWTLRGGDVTTLTDGADSSLLQRYGDRWAACPTCEHLIASGKTRTLADRAATTDVWRTNPDAYRRITELQHSFLQGLRPGRTLITTTAWPATALTPQDLPKVRDRLTSLYRGHDNLPDPINDSDLRRTVADSLDRAKLYWIDDEFTDLAEQATRQLPEAVFQDNDPPTADGLLIWSRPATHRQIAAMSWTGGPDGYHIACYRHIGSGLDNATLQRVREQVGWLAPTTINHLTPATPIPHDRPAAILIVTWLLIAQQIADTVPADLHTNTHKTYARQQRPTPDVRIVHIKARTTRTPKPAASAGSRGRGPLQEREWVGSYWRQQPFGPGLSQRKPIYVKSYLRGPDDKPIRVSTTVRILGTTPKQAPDSDHHTAD